MSEERLHTAVLVSPAHERRRLRRQRRQAAERLQQQQRQRERQAEQEQRDAERAERQATHYLPNAVLGSASCMVRVLVLVLIWVVDL